MGTYCSYCQDGPYKTELIDKENGIGGLVNGYWFCGWCYELGMKDRTDNEQERMEMLTQAADSKNSGKFIDVMGQ